MTYQELFYLKYKLGLTTYELFLQCPADAARVREIALLEVPENVLREIIKEGSVLEKLLRLKRRLVGNEEGHEGGLAAAKEYQDQRFSEKTPIFRNFS